MAVGWVEAGNRVVLVGMLAICKISNLPQLTVISYLLVVFVTYCSFQKGIW